MAGIGTFEILAEVSIGLAGFGSIAVVLAQGRRDMEPADRFRTLGLYMTSLGALFLALLPIGISHMRVEERGIWQASSAALAVYLIWLTVMVLVLRRRYLPKIHYGGPVLVTVVVVTTVINLVAQVLNVGAWTHPPNPSPYFFGVVWVMGYGCIFLIRLIFHRPEDESLLGG